MSGVLERLIPSDVSDAALVDHYARYLFAAQFARPGMAVLDVACGVGYGSALIAGLGNCKVTGADIAKEAIDHARSHYAQDNLVFHHEPIEALPDKVSEQFDMIVSFETIEHVQDPAAAIKVFASLLKPDGIAIVSVPNDIGLGIHNEFHLHRFSQEDFESLLAGAFKARRLGWQNYGLSSTVWFNEKPETSPLPGTVHLHRQETIDTALSNPEIARSQPAAFVAIVAHDNATLQRLNINNIGTDSLAAWVDERGRQTEYERAKTERIAELDAEVQRIWAEAQRISKGYEEQTTVIRDQNAMLDELRKSIADSSARIEMLESKLHSRRDALKRLFKGGAA